MSSFTDLYHNLELPEGDDPKGEQTNIRMEEQQTVAEAVVAEPPTPEPVTPKRVTSFKSDLQAITSKLNEPFSPLDIERSQIGYTKGGIGSQIRRWQLWGWITHVGTGAYRRTAKWGLNRPPRRNMVKASDSEKAAKVKKMKHDWWVRNRARLNKNKQQAYKPRGQQQQKWEQEAHRTPEPVAAQPQQNGTESKVIPISLPECPCCHARFYMTKP